MPTTEARTTVPQPTADDTTHPACAACPHPWDAHDVIGVRYCSASVTAGLDRGCVCVRTTP
jgi:hypothetical protein